MISRAEKTTSCASSLMHMRSMCGLSPFTMCFRSLNTTQRPEHRHARLPTFALPCAINSRTTRLPSLVCTSSARTSWQLLK
jgi:hypothetical protein